MIRIKTDSGEAILNYNKISYYINLYIIDKNIDNEIILDDR